MKVEEIQNVVTGGIYLKLKSDIWKFKEVQNTKQNPSTPIHTRPRRIESKYV